MPGPWALSYRLLAACVCLRAAGAVSESGQRQRRSGGGWGPQAEALGRCESELSPMQDYIIRTRDSLNAGAAFLSSPSGISSPAECVRACCRLPGCTAAVVERGRARAGGGGGGLDWARGLKLSHNSAAALSCYLFNCTYRGRDVCRFSPHQGYSSFTRGHSGNWQPGPGHHGNRNDEAPHCDAGQDLALLLPTDWVLLDGRGSSDDRGIVRYEWTLLQGDPSVDMKSPQPGMLRLSGLREGMYVIRLSVTDTIGQKSDDNVTVTVMPPKRQTTDCTGVCSRYQFICDDGCCIDITMACDGTAQCPDKSDETFCQSFNVGRKSITHATLAASSEQDRAMWPSSDSFHKTSTVNHKPTQSSRTEGMDKPNPSQLPEYCLVPPAPGPCEGHFPRWYFDSVSKTCRHFIYSGCQGNRNNFLQELDCKNGCTGVQGDNPLETSTVETSEADVLMSKISHGRGIHPVPESGAVLPLALGLAITALLLLMIGCRLQLVRHRLKKLRPITSEESDYLINGMYL
ncbi:low-density lipoprotein receptor-related protein 11 isoform X2 [Chiloscyllium plagiosum]|uniref:low-density lipoprotein receptor-related protein 11 isoform X2 n=1 Tax=Chiloscyllium plagiosum TaxID=36176 RepID=UPI001CB86CDA|nr:low-density lipoprotein receptor-related protein 11 isoform X2 [Chiloscyllium plagiosum]